jgi:MoaA/NifB/PqqE/SkfB family radical SAM enzyme
MDAQLEIQLGHLCNNRCVFCVSGQLTSQRKAPILDAADIVRALDSAWAEGYRRVTLLGGEPTIQPFFMEVLRHAVETGFEVVIFSNGSKPGRTNLIDEVAATGGRIEWRFSFQGATREAHERTTRRKGSFAQLVRSVDRARALGHKVTVNMCVVQQNHDSVDRFPELLVPRGVAALHLDMLNPYDTGTATPEEITRMMVRYSDLRAPLERMIAAFPEGYDVTVGNLPYCVAPTIARVIHHGGQPTWTMTANDQGASALRKGRRKYSVKQAFLTKPDRCRQCVFDDRCRGVFDAYAERHGTDELQPITPEHLAEIDRDGSLFAIRTAASLRTVIAEAALPAPFDRVTVTEPSPREVQITLAAGDAIAVTLALRSTAGGLAATTEASLSLEASSAPRDATEAALRWIWGVLTTLARPVHPLGPDAIATLPRTVAARLARLRARAPFGALTWERAHAIEGGVEIALVSPSGEQVIAWMTETRSAPRGGYRVEGVTGEPSRALVEGVRALLVALGRLPEEAISADDRATP